MENNDVLTINSITIGDDSVKNLLLQQEDPLSLQDKLRALFSAEEKTDNPFPINARELHSFLGVTTAYKDWFPRNIEKIDAIEGQDFCSKMSESSGGRPSTFHLVTLDTAKELAMIQRSNLGKLVRRYLIWAEKKLRTLAAVPKIQLLSPLEILKQQVAVMESLTEEQKRQALVLEQQQNILEQHSAALSDVTQRVVQGEIVTASQQQRLDQQGAAIADLQRAFDDKGPREEIKGLVSDIVKGTALTDRPFSYRDAYNIFYQFCWQHGRINLAYRLSNLKKRQQAAGWTETKVAKLNVLDVIDADPTIWQTVRDVIGILQNFLRETLSKKEEPSE